MSMDDLMRAMGQGAQAPVDNDALRRIANAAELSAALDAHRFFKEQKASERALAKLGDIIQARTSELCQ